MDTTTIKFFDWPWVEDTVLFDSWNIDSTAVTSLQTRTTNTGYDSYPGHVWNPPNDGPTALDVSRGRDHQICAFGQFGAACRLPNSPDALSDPFAEPLPNVDTQARLPDSFTTYYQLDGLFDASIMDTVNASVHAQRQSQPTMCNQAQNQNDQVPMEIISGSANDNGYQHNHELASYSSMVTSPPPNVNFPTSNTLGVQVKPRPRLLNRTRASVSREYICQEPGCISKPFKRRTDFQRHMASHRQGLFACPFRDCDRVGIYAFKRKDKLNEHVATMHGVQPVQARTA